MNEINWNSKFIASQSDNSDDSKKIILKGVLLDSQLNKNQWMIESEDFQQVAKDFIGLQIRADHSEKISDVLGKIVNTELDGPHKEAKAPWDPATDLDHVHFFAEIMSMNNDILIPLKLGYIDHISPAVYAKTLLCSECKTPMADKFLKTCGCEAGGLLLKDISPRECSIVASPAYPSTVMKPYGFGAAVDETLNTQMAKEQVLSIVEDELNKRSIKFI